LINKAWATGVGQPNMDPANHNDPVRIWNAIVCIQKVFRGWASRRSDSDSDSSSMSRSRHLANIRELEQLRKEKADHLKWKAEKKRKQREKKIKEAKEKEESPVYMTIHWSVD
jgi:hypothetical protein